VKVSSDSTFLLRYINPHNELAAAGEVLSLAAVFFYCDLYCVRTNKNQTPIGTNSVLEENTHIFGSYVRTKMTFLYPENPWLCQGFKEALAMSRKRKPPML